MQSLPKDVAMEMALNLSPPDLINFCSTQKNYKIICDSKIFWLKKFSKDYPNEKEITMENAKEVYVRKFRVVSIKIENFIDEMISEIFNKSFIKFINIEYKKSLYNNLYKLYTDTKNDLSKMGVSNRQEMDDYLYDQFYSKIPPYIREFYPNEQSGEEMTIKCQYFYTDLIRDEI